VLSFFLALSEAKEFFKAVRAASAPAISDRSGVPPPGVGVPPGAWVALAMLLSFEIVLGADFGWKCFKWALPRKYGGIVEFCFESEVVEEAGGRTDR
jgi:hypothetical protein